jgi:hypothetical protein
MVTAHLSFIIKAVAAERVAERGGLLPKNSVFPILRVAPYPLKREQKVADVCQNWLTSLSADLFSTIEFSSSIFTPEHKQMAIIPNEKASIPGCIIYSLLLRISVI